MAETGRPQQEENEMASISERRQSDDLYESILALKDLESCKRFFNDLCSPTERRAMEQRFEVAPGCFRLAPATWTFWKKPAQAAPRSAG